MHTDRVRTATSSQTLMGPAPSPKILIETSAWGSTLVIQMQLACGPH